MPSHAESLLDHYLPRYDVVEHHSLQVNAPVERAYDAVLGAPLGDSLIVRALLRLRALPSMLTRNRCDTFDARSATLLDLIGHGFFLVDEQQGREIVIGTVGDFWKLTGGSKGGAVEDLLSGPPPGSAAALWNFRVARNGRGSTVHTETRVLCGDESSRRSFKRYWRIIGPFSALIRKNMLVSIRAEAESERDSFL